MREARVERGVNQGPCQHCRCAAAAAVMAPQETTVLGVVRWACVWGVGVL